MTLAFAVHCHNVALAAGLAQEVIGAHLHLEALAAQQLPKGAMLRPSPALPILCHESYLAAPRLQPPPDHGNFCAV